MTKEVVFISGAGGFIALHIINQLVLRNYAVVGSVQTEEEGERVVKNFKSKFKDGLELSYVVIPDIAVEGSFDDTFKAHQDIKYVIHTVSPVNFNTGKSIEDAFIKPAVTGTTNVLSAILKYGPNVTKVVHTSSFGAIRNGFADSKKFIHTENTWNPITLPAAEKIEKQMVGTRSAGLVGYSASKTFAEKLAWTFVEKEKPQFTLTSVNPPFVFGPQMFDDSVRNGTMNESVQLVSELLKTKTPENDNDPYSIASISLDVRDAALFHVLALETDLSGNRLFPVLGKFSQQSLLNIINDNFPTLKGKISKGNPDLTQEIEDTIILYDNSHTRKITGDIVLIPLEKTIVDLITQIKDTIGLD